jgi:hypothetical protein
MSSFALFHTVLSLLPVGFGFAALFRHGNFVPSTRLGKWFIGTMLAGTLSGFGFVPILGFTPGQALGLLTLVLLALGTLTVRGQWRKDGYVQTIALTTSYLLLMVFLTTETLVRLPLDQPFALGPADPSLNPVRLGLFAAYGALLGLQLRRIHADRVFESRLARLLGISRIA